MAKEVIVTTVNTDGEVIARPYSNPVWERFKSIFKNGRRSMDDTPIELPAGYTAPLTLEQKMARIMRDQRVLARLEQEGLETFDEADDFNVGDDDDDDYVWENDPDFAAIAASEQETIAPIKTRTVNEIVSGIKGKLASKKAPTPSPDPKTEPPKGSKDEGQVSPKEKE